MTPATRRTLRTGRLCETSSHLYMVLGAKALLAAQWLQPCLTRCFQPIHCRCVTPHCETCGDRCLSFISQLTLVVTMQHGEGPNMQTELNKTAPVQRCVFIGHLLSSVRQSCFQERQRGNRRPLLLFLSVVVIFDVGSRLLLPKGWRGVTVSSR